MKQEEIDRLTSLAGIRPSPVRTLLLRALDESGRPMSSQELGDVLETVNLSSITRTLALFVKVGLVHSVEDGSGAVRYEICYSVGSPHNHNDLHPHFHCVMCGRTFCFDHIAIPEIDIPDGYAPLSINFVIKGRCPECDRRHAMADIKKEYDC